MVLPDAAVLHQSRLSSQPDAAEFCDFCKKSKNNMGSQNSWGSVIGEITFTCFWSVCMIPAAIPHQPHEGTWKGMGSSVPFNALFRTKRPMWTWQVPEPRTCRHFWSFQSGTVGELETVEELVCQLHYFISSRVTTCTTHVSSFRGFLFNTPNHPKQKSATLKDIRQLSKVCLATYL